MKRIAMFILFSSSCLFIGCQAEETSSSSDPIIFDETEKIITFLFSDDEQLEGEMSYYDALLDFKRAYPDHIDAIKIVTSQHEELVEYYNIDVFPTLLVIENFETLLRLEGFKEFSEIFHSLETNLITSIEESL